MKKMLVITSTNLAANPRLLKELLLVKDDYETQVLATDGVDGLII